jgi:hypothetical protein
MTFKEMNRIGNNLEEVEYYFLKSREELGLIELEGLGLSETELLGLTELEGLGLLDTEELGLTDALGLCESELDELGLTDALGLCDLETLGLTEELPTLGELLGLGLLEGLTELLGDTDGEILEDGEGDKETLLEGETLRLIELEGETDKDSLLLGLTEALTEEEVLSRRLERDYLSLLQLKPLPRACKTRTIRQYAEHISNHPELQEMLMQGLKYDQRENAQVFTDILEDNYL